MCHLTSFCWVHLTIQTFLKVITIVLHFRNTKIVHKFQNEMALTVVSSNFIGNWGRNDEGGSMVLIWGLLHFLPPRLSVAQGLRRRGSGRCSTLVAYASSMFGSHGVQPRPSLRLPSDVNLQEEEKTKRQKKESTCVTVVTKCAKNCNHVTCLENKTCSKHAQNMLKICTKHAQNMHKTCTKHAALHIL